MQYGFKLKPTPTRGPQDEDRSLFIRCKVDDKDVPNDVEQEIIEEVKERQSIPVTRVTKGHTTLGAMTTLSN